MAFAKKTWKDRIAEFPTRRRLTKEDNTSELVTVAREEGTLSQEGDAFSAENMNDLESRIDAEFTAVNGKLNIRYNEDTDKVQLLFNGIWTDWKNGNMLKKYLYVSGNECGDLTGGYAVGYYSNHCTGAKVTNDNYLQINISGDKQYKTYAWVITKKLINTTGYTKLKAKFYTSKATLKAALSLSQQYVAGAQSNVTNIVYPEVVVKTDSLASTSPIEVEIDISAYQGNYYVVFGARDCIETGSIYCSEIYLI